MAEIIIEVAVSPFLGTLFENLSSLIHKEVGQLWGIDKEMKKLAGTLSTIRDVLEDAEAKQVMNKSIGNWLLKLKDAVYDADDVLDEWATETLQSESSLIHKTFTNQVYYSLSSFFHIKQVKFSRKIAREINEVMERFHEIAAERYKFHLRGAQESKAEFPQNRETTSILTEPLIFGRDDDKEYIVSLLLKDQEVLSIYPIVGIGGLGKTTVAQLVYNDKRVQEYFEVRIWVCVSEDFDLRRLTKAVIVSITGEICLLEDLDPLQRRLQENLAGKRFLLVLDDVWNENQEVWNKFGTCLRCGARGSSVVVTTRLETVASIMGTVPPYLLKFLSEDDCWSLFKQRAFGLGNEGNPNLTRIGKEIVKKCGGVPLAAKVLGGLMRFKIEENEWLYVRDSEIWDLPENDENTILPALRLSYTHLSSDLKQCIAYCSIFPKDYRMQKEEVIHLWMANGLLQCKERSHPEDIGSGIFNALLWRFFFHDAQKDEEGNIVSCMMHDLVHDLVCSISINECSVVDGSQIVMIPNGIRHVSVTCNPIQFPLVAETIHQSSTSLRTLILFVHMRVKWPSHVKLSEYTCLRVLSMESMDISVVPDSIGKLIHLRYLNVSATKIVSLPESLCGLRNLQTLKLERCYFLQKLPKYTGNIISLRHLDLRKCNRLTQMPFGIGKLSHLQTLSIFIVGVDNGLRLKELHGLDNLRGELMLKGLEHLRSLRDAKEANIVVKKSLHSLSLVWSDSHFEEGNDTDVVEGLQPHPNMKKLHIEGYQGHTLPKWLKFSSLPKLVKISLSKCRRCEHLPLFGGLPLLKSLSIFAMDSLISFNGEGPVNGFPSLEELEFDDVPKLKELSLLSKNSGDELIFFPCLKKLRIKNCSMLTRLMLSMSLERFVVHDCNEMALQALKNLPCLSSLRLSGFSELMTFPKGVTLNLISLQSLSIWSCKKLETLPTEVGSLSKLTSLVVFDCDDLISLPQELRNLPYLKTVTVERCCKLKSLPEMGSKSLISLRIIKCSTLTNLSEGVTYLTTLQHLHIYYCPMLDISMVGFEQLRSLQSLIIGGFPELTSLPEEMQHLSTLQTLQVWGFSSLVSLPEWIGDLTKLQYLAISFCKNLSILADELQNLTFLQILWIENCHPDLHRRYEKGKGEDWHKISHIPNLRITENSTEEENDDGRVKWCFG